MTRAESFLTLKNNYDFETYTASKIDLAIHFLGIYIQNYVWKIITMILVIVDGDFTKRFDQNVIFDLSLPCVTSDDDVTQTRTRDYSLISR